MSTAGEGGVRRVLGRLLPDAPGAWVRAMAWASLLANALLVLTGGLVRLTASGLGCPTWPRCTDASWTNTPEMGMHGVIEFGNRLLTFVLVAVAVLTFLSVWRSRRTHPGLFVLALVMALGIPVQAVLGGITVITGLNPWVVGVHFLVSAGLITLGGILVDRARRASLPGVARAERPGQVTTGRRTMRLLGAVLAVSVALTVYLGTLVTGTGPHSGDSGDVARHTFDAYLVTRAHAVPVYALVATSFLTLALAVRAGWPRPVRRMLLLLVVLVVAQGAVGYYQFFTGLPVVAVVVHLVGAAALCAVTAMTVEKMYAVSAVPQPSRSSGDLVASR
ncbi:cytochrome oxidase assembly protein [Serinicoccus sp. CNJ-927]|uniref:COX15/CtaA family protein n=1 Tax=Serinicoccus sp. CNJ-927 TaxID=1904970 RepID=UPI000959D533|nr:COX15/CtaA family protein [Serinicoccus sp. CNJ-927]OLT44051.1 cytochrome oxidase assembly protein [Serinicoccus sp. CNJ-927]